MKPYAIMLQTDADDKFITESILEEINSNVPVIFISHTSDLQAVIKSMGEPTVILVNDSSRHTAREQLTWLKSDPSINHIPVVVLGEVVSDEYIRQYYRAGANTYIVKPSSITGTRLKIDTFFKYWFDVAEV
jgi:response regulator RpfG family c-di-GMP phosphodiesterase